jgi:hypothetical protein
MSWELHDLDRFTCSGPDAKSAGARPRQSHALPHGRATELKQAKPRVTSPRVSKGCGSGAMTYETLRGPGPIGARSSGAPAWPILGKPAKFHSSDFCPEKGKNESCVGNRLSI